MEESPEAVVVATVAGSSPTVFRSDSCGENTVAKTESGSDDPPGTLALCRHDAAEHCRGSARGFRAAAAAIVATTAASLSLIHI